MLNLQAKVPCFVKKDESGNFTAADPLTYSIEEVGVDELEAPIYKVEIGGDQLFTNSEGVRIIYALADAADTVAM